MALPAKKTRRRGRKRTPARDKEKVVKFSVPPRLFDYLDALSKRKFKASSPGQMARAMLIERAEFLHSQKYLGLDFDLTPPE